MNSKVTPTSLTSPACLTSPPPNSTNLTRLPTSHHTPLATLLALPILTLTTCGSSNIPTPSHPTCGLIPLSLAKHSPTISFAALAISINPKLSSPSSCPGTISTVMVQMYEYPAGGGLSSMKVRGRRPE
ncbi:MAG: hypothetical protein Q9205_007714 [Flavoplaca limonia]